MSNPYNYETHPGRWLTWEQNHGGKDGNGWAILKSCFNPCSPCTPPPCYDACQSQCHNPCRKRRRRKCGGGRRRRCGGGGYSS